MTKKYIFNVLLTTYIAEVYTDSPQHLSDDDLEKLANAVYDEFCCTLKTHKYDSTKLGWCRYPFHGWDYCWSYAQFVDGTLIKKGKKINDMKEFCRGCEFYIRKKLTKAQYLKLAEMIRKA